MTKFTIITVCYNAANIIEATIASVLSQTYTDYEYILVDGGSTDGTLDIIQKYAASDVRIRYVSEKDHGIYDAMNKGISMSNGQYLQMLNAGDRLYDAEVLRAVADKIEASAKQNRRADIYYGNILYEYPDGTESVRVYSSFCGTQFYYLLGDCINHQSIFARRSCFKQTENFDLSYTYCADRDWMIRQHKKGKKYSAMNIMTCRYSLDPNSASVKHEADVCGENKRMVKKYYPLGYPIYFLLDKIRHGKTSAKLLHKAYEIVFLRGKTKQ